MDKRHYQLKGKSQNMFFIIQIKFTSPTEKETQKCNQKKKEERNKNKGTKKGKKENETETRRSLIPIFLS